MDPTDPPSTFPDFDPRVDESPDADPYDWADGLSDETLAAILEAATVEQIRAFTASLTTTPQKAETLRKALLQHGNVLPARASRDTQLRRMRTIRDAAVAAGYPVATTNKGYWLGDWADVLAAAARAERFAHGALKRAQSLKQLAAKKLAAPAAP